MRIISTFCCAVFAASILGHNTAHSQTTPNGNLAVTDGGNETATANETTTTPTNVNVSTNAATTLPNTLNTTNVVASSSMPTGAVVTTNATSTINVSTTETKTSSEGNINVTSAMAGPAPAPTEPTKPNDEPTGNSLSPPTAPPAENNDDKTTSNGTSATKAPGEDEASTGKELDKPPTGKSSSGGVIAGVIIGIAALFVLVCLVRRKLRNDRRRDAQRQHLFRNPIKFEEDSIL